jgi:hypothetical protein
VTLDFKDSFRGKTIEAAKWVEIDPDGSISQNDDLLLNDVADGWNKALISKPAFARAAGRTFYAELDTGVDTPGNDHFMLGLDLDQQTNPSYTALVHGMYLNNYLLTTYEKGSHTGPNTQPYATGTRYEFSVELKATGAKYRVRGGAYPSWTLVKETSTHSDSPMRVAFVQYSHQAMVHFAAVLPAGLLAGTPGTVEASTCFTFQNTWTTAPSNEASATTPTLDAPTGLTAIALTEATLRLAWQDATPGEAGWQVERCKGAGCTNFALVGTPAANAITWDDAGLEPATPYRYRVRAYGGTTCAWTTAWTAVVEATTLAPPAPTGLAGTSPNTSLVTLTWTDTTGSETGFRLQRCEGAGCSSFADVATPAANVTTVDDTTVCNGITYVYRIRAENPAWGGGASAWSTPLTITATAARAPTGLTATRTNEIKVRLAWTRTTTDETGFVVERCAGTGCTDFAQVGQVGAGVVTMDDTPLVPSTTYLYRVRATKTATCGWTGPASNVATVTTTIPAPTGFTATAPNTTRIDLSWADATVARTGAEIERCLGSTCAFSPADSFSTGLGTTYQDASVCKGSTYRYRVRSTGFAGPSPTSPWSATVTRATASPTAPGSVAIATLTDTTVTVTWTDNTTDETGFRIESCAGQGCSTFSTSGTVPAGQTSFVATGLQPATWNTFRVVAYKTATCGWEATGGTATTFTAPAAPGSLVATAVNSQVIRLTWSDLSGDEQAFELEKLVWNGIFVLRAVLPAGVTTFTDKVGIEPGKAYSYRVRAVRGQVKSGYTPVATVTTPAYRAGDSTCF